MEMVLPEGPGNLLIDGDYWREVGVGWKTLSSV